MREVFVVVGKYVTLRRTFWEVRLDRVVGYGGYMYLEVLLP